MINYNNYFPKIFYLSITILLLIISSTIGQSDGPSNPYFIFGYCFEENKSFCSQDTEVIIYVNNRTADNISTTVQPNGMYGLSIGNLQQGWNFNDNLTLILKIGTMYSITTTVIQHTGSGNQVINLTLYRCHANYELFNNQCYHKCDLNRDGIITLDYNDLMTAYKCFLGITNNCDKINFRDWQSMKNEYQCFIGTP